MDRVGEERPGIHPGGSAEQTPPMVLLKTRQAKRKAEAARKLAEAEKRGGGGKSG